MCTPLSRRQFLRYSTLAATTPVFMHRVWRPSPAFAQVASTAVPMNLELVTLSDTTATLTWFTGDPTMPDEFGRPSPIPADTVVELGTSPLTMQRVVDRDDGTPFHYVELTGLEAGRPYFYRALSNGLPAVPNATLPEPAATGTFTTLTPPAGALLFRMCWANDVHIGEMTSGLALSNDAFPGGGLPPGFAADPENPYWRFMAEAAMAESRQRGAELLIVNGDLTSGGAPVHLAEARRIFDGFGSYREDYWVARGNHDRAHSGTAYDDCEPVPDRPDFNDCLRDEFFPSGQTYFSFDHRGIHFVGLDTNDADGNGAVDDGQFAWLEADLAAHSGTPTFVFGHHPVSEESAATAIPPVAFTLNPEDARRLEQRVAEHSVVGVYSAHTHRNRRTASANAPGVPFIELGAVKEYPGGYGVVSVYEGGYMVNFHKTRADPARAWSELSRGEYLGLYPYYTLGSLADRNFVIEADFSGLTPAPVSAPPGPPAGGAGPSGSGGTLPATGGAVAVGAAAAAMATGLALRRAADDR